MNWLFWVSLKNLRLFPKHSLHTINYDQTVHFWFPIVRHPSIAWAILDRWSYRTCFKSTCKGFDQRLKHHYVQCCKENRLRKREVNVLQRAHVLWGIQIGKILANENNNSNIWSPNQSFGSFQNGLFDPESKFLILGRMGVCTRTGGCTVDTHLLKICRHRRRWPCMGANRYMARYRSVLCVAAFCRCK